MARENNYLLGNGERLAQPVEVRGGGGDKNPPYLFPKALARIQDRLASVRARLHALPGDACPNGEAIAVITMHPRYISKSDFPADLLSAVGLRPVGSRPRTVTPERWGVKKHPVEAVTEDIFVAGPLSAFDAWAAKLPSWTMNTSGAEHLSHIEDLAPVDAKSKLKSIPTDRDRVLLEVVLHNGGDARIVRSFLDYARKHSAEPLEDRKRDVKGLTFVPVRVDPARAEELARFSFVRVARGMPSLRPFRPTILRVASGFDVQLPTAGPMDGTFRAVIFDGGIPARARGPLAPWVTLVEPADVGASVPGFEEHGLAVTTSFIFGPLSPGGSAPIPYCSLDHVRVLGEKDAAGTDLQYVDVLDRIEAHLKKHGQQYQFANISLGPRLPVEDDDVTAWTATLDQYFAHGQAVVTVAAGNDGELDPMAGLNRVQPPADGVNLLAVGAADSSGESWARATYSCVGPGRCPGLVKPDGVAFGGSDAEAFQVLGTTLRAMGVQGTSFAAPYALRSAAAVRVQLGKSLGALAIRALLIHRADGSKEYGKPEVGWGRFETDPVRLITCDDDESLVVFQGQLPVGEHLRAKIPTPQNPLQGMVTLTATLVIAPEVDPEHPSTYTRSGLEVAFRPHAGKQRLYKDGSQSKHPKTTSFFTPTNMYGASEWLVREDGHKWEPCLRNHRSFRAASLKDPAFDIYYHHRAGGAKQLDPKPIDYALVVSLKAPKVADLYDRVVRAYANILVPIKPQIRIQIRR
jgi:hypothetical protein